MQSILVTLLGVFALFARAAASRAELDKFVATDGIVYATEASLAAAFDGPRDYSLMMLLTSESGRVDCQFCRVLGPDFRLVAHSYDAQTRKAGAERDLYFVIAEPENVLETFKELGLSHVPNVAVFEPTKSRSEAKQGIKGPRQFMSFMSNADQQAVLLKQLSRMGYHIAVQKPFPVLRLVKTVATIAMLGAGVFFFWPTVVRVYRAKQLWLAFSLMCVIMFIAGHMFNVTRGMPFMGFDGKNVRAIEPGFSTQVAAETQILAVVYALLSFTTIGLIKFVPRINGAAAQTSAAVFGAVIVYIFYSVLLDIFKIKMGGFPMWLLPFNFV